MSMPMPRRPDYVSEGSFAGDLASGIQTGMKTAGQYMQLRDSQAKFDEKKSLDAMTDAYTTGKQAEVEYKSMLDAETQSLAQADGVDFGALDEQGKDLYITKAQENVNPIFDSEYYQPWLKAMKNAHPDGFSIEGASKSFDPTDFTRLNLIAATIYAKTGRDVTAFGKEKFGGAMAGQVDGKLGYAQVGDEGTVRPLKGITPTPKVAPETFRSGTDKYGADVDINNVSGRRHVVSQKPKEKGSPSTMEGRIASQIAEGKLTWEEGAGMLADYEKASKGEKLYGGLTGGEARKNKDLKTASTYYSQLYPKDMAGRSKAVGDAPLVEGKNGKKTVPSLTQFYTDLWPSMRSALGLGGETSTSASPQRNRRYDPITGKIE